MFYHILLQYLLPKHILSRLSAKIANCRIPLIKNFVIKQYHKFYKIDMSEALEPNLLNYPTFNAFFTRALKPEARPLLQDPKTISSPVDGKIWQIGAVGSNQIVAKGRGFTLEQLLADPQTATQFKNANFAVLYLAPTNYHRIHMPISGKLLSMRYVPGNLFSVAPKIVEHLPEIFAKNERVIALFETAVGKIAVILVGAIVVGSIETKWAGVVTPNHQNQPTNWDYRQQNLVFERGAEIGNFKLGSTVILLFPEATTTWDPILQPNIPIKMGQKLGHLI